LPARARLRLHTIANRNSISPRRRCTQSRLQKALRYNPKLYLFAETVTPTSVDDLKMVIALTVSIDVHTNSQLRFRTLLKAAFCVGIPLMP
jgi:hypothetical protein